MAEYICKLGTPEGRINEQVFTSESESALREELERKGLYVFQVKEKAAFAGLLSFGGFRKGKITLNEFLLFNHEMVTLLRAGLPILASLDILLERMKNELFKGVLTDIREKIKSGSSLSDAFADHPEHFSKLYAASLKAGERSGDLEGVIKRYIAYLKIVAGIQKKVMSAIWYPIILLLLSAAVVAILVTHVIPKFSDFYKGFDAELPFATQFLLAVSGVIREHLVLLVLAVSAAAFLLRGWFKTTRGREIFDGLKLKAPLVGAVWLKYSLSQLSRALATMLGGGIPLINSVEIAAGAVGNSVISKRVGASVERIKEGQSLSSSLESTGLVTHMVLEMIKVGESTGALKDMLNSVADYYDEEIETHIATLVSLIEPVILVIMGLIIAGILMSMYIPLFSLINTVQ